MKPLLTALMLRNAALFVFGALQHAGVAIGSPRKFWPPYRVTMGSRPAYDVLRSTPAKGSVLKRSRIGWPAYRVFGRFMMSLSLLLCQKHHMLAKWPAYGVL